MVIKPSANFPALLFNRPSRTWTVSHSRLTPSVCLRTTSTGLDSTGLDRHGRLDIITTQQQITAGDHRSPQITTRNILWSLGPIPAGQVPLVSPHATRPDLVLLVHVCLDSLIPLSASASVSSLGGHLQFCSLVNPSRRGTSSTALLCSARTSPHFPRATNKTEHGTTDHKWQALTPQTTHPLPPSSLPTVCAWSTCVLYLDNGSTFIEPVAWTPYYARSIVTDLDLEPPTRNALAPCPALPQSLFTATNIRPRRQPG